MWLIIVGIIFLLGMGVLIGGFIMSRRSDHLIEERLGIAEEEDLAEEVDISRQSPVGDAFNRALASRGLGDNLATQLARANLKITVGEFIAAIAIIVIAAGGVTYFLSRDILTTAGVCLAGFFAPRFYINMLRGRRLKAFNEQLGDAINLLVNSLRAGYSILQAMEAISQEMGPPISEEFGRVVQEVQLGLTLEQALNHMIRRITSGDLDMMITAINVQREVGGNLAEVLDSISHTIRERIRIKGEMRALTAQSRVSGYMVGMVPVALAGFIYLINPDFMSLLFTETCGWIMIGVAVTGVVVGFIIINKVMQIDV